MGRLLTVQCLLLTLTPERPPCQKWNASIKTDKDEDGQRRRWESKAALTFSSVLWLERPLPSPLEVNLCSCTLGVTFLNLPQSAESPLGSRVHLLLFPNQEHHTHHMLSVLYVPYVGAVSKFIVPFLSLSPCPSWLPYDDMLRSGCFRVRMAVFHNNDETGYVLYTNNITHLIYKCIWFFAFLVFVLLRGLKKWSITFLMCCKNLFLPLKWLLSM